jgi:hypothetical protein
MTKTNILLPLVMLLLLSSFANAEEKKEYHSPDGKHSAYVIPLPNAPYGRGESKIVIKSKDGKTLCSESYGSEDGEHGFGVEKAAWTPDSNFLVYSMSSSGGHQAWHFPTYFISSSNCKAQKLDDYVGPITDPDFILKAPDIVKTTGREKATLDEATFEVRLSEVIKQAKKK